MENIELEDLVYTYPRYDEPSIQTEISEEEEFRKFERLAAKGGRNLVSCTHIKSF